MPQQEEEKIVESKNQIISEEAKDLVQDLHKFQNTLPVDVVKTLTLLKPKKRREPKIIQIEKTMVDDYVEGKIIKESSH